MFYEETENDVPKGHDSQTCIRAVKTDPKANREIKDNVFSLLFGNDAKNAIDVSNSFLGTNYAPDTKVSFTTLTSTLAKGRINDLSFILDDRLIVLIEHQSTINESMPYRMLQYIAEIYKQLHAGKDEYRAQKFILQRPKFIVLYNGHPDKMQEDTQILRLSDMFTEYNPQDKEGDGGLTDLELTVKVYNINNGRNKNMVKRCATLHEYSIFIDMVHEYHKTMTFEEAVMKAIEDCIGQNILKAFLLKHKGRLVNMLTSEWNMDLAVEVAQEEGMARGEKRKTLEIARAMRAKGIDINTVSEITGLSVDEILRLQT